MKLSLEPVSLRFLIEEAAELVRPLADQSGIRLEVGETGEAVLADNQKLKQVLLNLLSNAIKFNRPDGRVTLSARLATAGRVAIDVVDTGIGLAPHQLQHLFEPINRLGVDRSTIEGTGLGLVLSRGLMEAMHGQLTVSSEAGRGSTFTAELPHADPVSTGARTSNVSACDRPGTPRKPCSMWRTTWPIYSWWTTLSQSGRVFDCSAPCRPASDSS